MAAELTKELKEKRLLEEEADKVSEEIITMAEEAASKPKVAPSEEHIALETAF